jgi:hypothetical protein
MKKFTLLVLALFTLLYVNVLEAQINIGGNPVSYNHEVERVARTAYFYSNASLRYGDC